MRFVLLGGVCALLLGACQSPEESFASADYTCRQAGLRPGTAQFQRCVDATYSQNRRQSDSAANAAAVGVAAGVIGGAVIGAAAARPGYGYYRCNAWGCW